MENFNLGSFFSHRPFETTKCILCAAQFSQTLQTYSRWFIDRDNQICRERWFYFKLLSGRSLSDNAVKTMRNNSTGWLFSQQICDSLQVITMTTRTVKVCSDCCNFLELTLCSAWTRAHGRVLNLIIRLRLFYSAKTNSVHMQICA